MLNAQCLCDYAITQICKFPFLMLALKLFLISLLMSGSRILTSTLCHFHEDRTFKCFPSFFIAAIFFGTDANK